MSSRCPRCGAEMSGGICDNCGFPLTKIRRRAWEKSARNDGEKGKKFEILKRNA